MDNREENKVFINALTNRFEAREIRYVDDTNAILDLIKDNIIAAFDEILELPSDQISWLDISLEVDDKDMSYLVLVFSITYFPEQANEYITTNFGVGSTIPDEEEDLDEMYDDDTDEILRIITFGIPTAVAHLPKQSIVNFILQADPRAVSKKESTDTYNFDVSSLDDHQLSQIKLFTKGTIH